jgi:hypothetical protein
MQAVLHQGQRRGEHGSRQAPCRGLRVDGASRRIPPKGPNPNSSTPQPPVPKPLAYDTLSSQSQEMSVEPLVDFCLQATREEPGTRPTARECLSLLSIIFEMSTGAQPAPYGPVVASDAAADRHVPVPLAQRRASPAGEAAPGGSSASAGDPSAVAGSAGSLQKIGHLAPMSHHAPSLGSHAAVESVVAVACCSEDVAWEALELSGGDVNRAVDVLVSGRLEELRARRSLATQSRGRNQNHGAGQSSSQEGGRTEPGKVFLPSGIGTGSGTVNFTDGSRYEGQWVNGECNGQGVYTNAKGMYRGQFKSGLMHGTGYHVWRDSGMEYEGEVGRHEISPLSLTCAQKLGDLNPFRSGTWGRCTARAPS